MSMYMRYAINRNEKLSIDGINKQKLWNSFLDLLLYEKEHTNNSLRRAIILQEGLKMQVCNIVLLVDNKVGSRARL